MESSHVPIYTGDSDGDELESWIGWMEEYFDWNEFATEIEKLQMGLAFIYGQAYDWVMDTQQQTNSFETWNELTYSLRIFRSGQTLALNVTEALRNRWEEFRLEMDRSIENQRVKLFVGFRAVEESLYQMTEQLTEAAVNSCAPDPTMTLPNVTTSKEHVSQQISFAEEPLPEALVGDTYTKLSSHKDLDQEDDNIETLKPEEKLTEQNSLSMETDLLQVIYCTKEPCLRSCCGLLDIVEEKTGLFSEAKVEGVQTAYNVLDEIPMRENLEKRSIRTLGVKRERNQGKLLKTWKYKFKNSLKAQRSFVFDKELMFINSGDTRLRSSLIKCQEHAKHTKVAEFNIEATMSDGDKFVKAMEIPAFNGDYPCHWISKLEKVFRISQYTDLENIQLVLMHVEKQSEVVKSWMFKYKNQALTMRKKGNVILQNKWEENKWDIQSGWDDVHLHINCDVTADEEEAQHVVKRNLWFDTTGKVQMSLSIVVKVLTVEVNSTSVGIQDVQHSFCMVKRHIGGGSHYLIHHNGDLCTFHHGIGTNAQAYLKLHGVKGLGLVRSTVDEAFDTSLLVWVFTETT